MLDLSTLNNEQKEAVLDFDHNLLVLSCAGSGKTRTITSKIVYALEKGIFSPSEICAVTFTNKAANEMRERVKSLLPEIFIDSLTIRTFHSLGTLLLRRFGDRIGIEKDFNIYDDDDSVQILKSAIEAHDEDIKRMQIENPKRDYSFNKKSMISKYYNYISRAKDLGLNPGSNKEELEEVSTDPLFKMLFKWYTEALRKTKNLDYADLIGESKRLLKESSETADYVHNRYHLVLVDEYQDSNTEQFNFLKLFKGENTQLVVVGDDDQSIYSFRGAEIKNILSFSTDFDNVREIRLEKNYRSSDEILLPAGELIKHNKNRHIKDIISATGKSGDKPTLTVYPDEGEEARSVSEDIKKRGNYKSTAILYRINALSQPFERELTSLSVPFRLVGARRFYDREEVKDSLSFLRLLLNHSDIISFNRIINKPSRGIGEKKIGEILSYSIDIQEGLKTFIDKTSGAASRNAKVFLDAWVKAEEDLDLNIYTLGDILMTGLNDTGIASYYQDDEKDVEKRKVKVENINQLVSALNEKEYYNSSFNFEDVNNERKKTKREDLEAFLERVTLDNTVEEDDKETDDAVTLISMHSVKGLEFDNVYAIGLESAIIPGERAELTKGNIEEERRLLYVAMTRARDHLYLSYSKRRMQWGQVKATLPSPFLTEIPHSSLNYVDESFYARLGMTKSGFDAFRFGTKKDNSTNTSKSNENSNYNKVKEVPSVKQDISVKKESEFKIGDKIMHSEKGEGEVKNVECIDGKFKITISSLDGREYKFIEGSNSKIKKI